MQVHHLLYHSMHPCHLSLATPDEVSCPLPGENRSGYHSPLGAENALTAATISIARPYTLLPVTDATAPHEVVNTVLKIA